ncbi:hypothetical protein [Capnocytophaga canis]|uniref:hypothetical protein n=1 Tax=Capnocytophaga canis TaxID=1848903 RepID=UPI0015625F47|nr:hypothetical protein [Capnocytophaga canis]
MRNKLIIALFLFAFKSFAQIATNHLFIIIDNKDGVQKTESRKIRSNDEGTKFHIEKTTYYKEHQEIDLIYENGEVSKIYEYFYVNEPENWQISFSFNHYANGGTINNFILMLPKERFEEIARERYYANYLETLWSKIDLNTIGPFYRKYEYYDKSASYAKGVYRSNVFIVFTSDLEKDYIPCYEVDVLISTIEEYCD